MSQAPTNDMTCNGYDLPKVTQFNVFLDNRVGRILELLEILHKQEIRVLGICVVETTDAAVVRVVVSAPEVFRKLLPRMQIAYSETDILVVALPPGHSLLELCRALVQAEVNIHYLYSIFGLSPSQPLAVLHTDDQNMTGRIAQRHGFTLMGEADLGNPPGEGSA